MLLTVLLLSQAHRNRLSSDQIDNQSVTLSKLSDVSVCLFVCLFDQSDIGQAVRQADKQTDTDMSVLDAIIHVFLF